ncbi:hypothetical protein KPH14_001174 [Odynerus spinipes]|uniref:Uncharacterized protein n=1 Tax=Odynerus spinipes TaxID=1348599 RepID=A0AAD9RQH1_9HYME|nr:hypothetical protein KPH14_001174 [Odynerus spinipes]
MATVEKNQICPLCGIEFDQEVVNDHLVDCYVEIKKLSLKLDGDFECSICGNMKEVEKLVKHIPECVKQKLKKQIKSYRLINYTTYTQTEEAIMTQTKSDQATNTDDRKTQNKKTQTPIGKNSKLGKKTSEILSEILKQIEVLSVKDLQSIQKEIEKKIVQKTRILEHRE